MSPIGRVRVLHVCTIALTAHAFIAPLAKFLHHRGYEVAIACSTGAQPDAPDDLHCREVSGARIHHVPIARTVRPIQDIVAIVKLWGLIRRLRPHIVHTQTSKAGVVGRLAARLAGTPIVIHTAHAFPFHTHLPPAVRWCYIVIERGMARLTDLIIVDTESVRSDGLREHVVNAPEKLVTVSMGLDLQKFSPSKSGPGNLRAALGVRPLSLVVGTVARLVPDKGIDCFLEMAAQILAVRKDVQFFIVGDGPIRATLQQRACELGIAPHVLFLGYRDDIRDLMEAMDVFVLPTKREGFGVVFAEAMAMGKATVGSRIGPVAEVVEDGVTGYLVLPDDAQGFAERVLGLLADEKKRLDFGMAGRRRVEQYFNETRMCDSIEGHYRHLLEAKKVCV
ncbi:MAG: glycosyltransferase family 4 protein [Nitrospiraceae bacterium]